MYRYVMVKLFFFFTTLYPVIVKEHSQTSDSCFYFSVEYNHHFNYNLFSFIYTAVIWVVLHRNRPETTEQRGWIGMSQCVCIYMFMGLKGLIQTHLCNPKLIWHNLISNDILQRHSHTPFIPLTPADRISCYATSISQMCAKSSLDYYCFDICCA